MQLFLATKAGSRIATGSWEQTFPEARYLHAVSIQHELKTTKFSLQWNSLDFRINRCTCRTFPVTGHVLQPPPWPAAHVVPDDNPGTPTRCWARLHPHSHPEMRDWRGGLWTAKTLSPTLRFLQSSKYHERFIILCSAALFSRHTQTVPRLTD